MAIYSVPSPAFLGATRLSGMPFPRFGQKRPKGLNPLSPISARFNQADIDQRNYERYLAFVCLDALRRQYGCWVDQQLHVDTYGTGLISPAEEAYRRSQD